MRFLALFDEVVIERFIIGVDGTDYGWAFGVESLDDGVGLFNVAATNTTNDLIDEIKSAFFGSEIRETEAGIGLNDANGCEFRQIEALGDSLGANNDVDFAGFDVVIEGIKALVLFVIAIKTGDFSVFKETF